MIPAARSRRASKGLSRPDMEQDTVSCIDSGGDKELVSAYQVYLRLVACGLWLILFFSSEVRFTSTQRQYGGRNTQHCHAPRICRAAYEYMYFF